MHPIARRLEIVEQVAFRMECGLHRGQASVLEQTARADELQQPIANVAIGATHEIDIEPPVRAFVSQHEGPRRDARNGIGDIVVSEPERPEKSCA